MNYEDRATETVERQTAKVPSLAFMGLAVGAMAASAALVLMGKKQLGNFVGQWAPSILITGLYNKLAKEVALPQRGLGGARRTTSPEGYSAGAGV
ncbi:hypothetical protein [Anaeromyxobacter sp. Fw109-5]|uniref:hypothetical protein n=1 Tax=Anaeromyxobacter sp. (strain Fw109-5) TaxID=404589 RepID=UPI0000ED8130|nr:hypothetical protein [Anaeromyxobacter sp. Fw109-5]ABS25189.1 conserved hypothetical protein [Anaeromyxobacter sp. Fw109-5]